MDQRWLSLTGICDVLKTNEKHIWWLVKNGHLEHLPGKGNERRSGARFLDPTPQYAERLRIGEIIYKRRVPLPTEFQDVSEAALLSVREIAEIMGWHLSTARNYFKEHSCPCIKGKGRQYLYMVGTVRDMLWARQGRALSKQRSPFLLARMIEFFAEYQTKESADVPTDAEYAADDEIQRKLAKIVKLPSPEREIAMRDFHSKVNLAKACADASQTSSC